MCARLSSMLLFHITSCSLANCRHSMILRKGQSSPYLNLTVILFMAAHKEKLENLTEDDKDLYEELIDKSGCAKFHYALQDCYFEHKDWRQCRKEMEDFKKCTDQQNKRNQQKN